MRRHWPGWIGRRVGRRGTSLLFLSVLDAVYAASLLTTDPAEESSTATVYGYADNIIPLAGWAAVWAAVGAVCLVQAFMVRDQLAFGCAVALKICWGGLYLLACIFADVERAHVAVAIWWAFAAWLMVIAGWPDRKDTPP